MKFPKIASVTDESILPPSWLKPRESSVRLLSWPTLSGISSAPQNERKESMNDQEHHNMYQYGWHKHLYALYHDNQQLGNIACIAALPLSWLPLSRRTVMCASSQMLAGNVPAQRSRANDWNNECWNQLFRKPSRRENNTLTDTAIIQTNPLGDYSIEPGLTRVDSNSGLILPSAF